MVSKPGEVAPKAAEGPGPGAPAAEGPKLLSQEEVNAIVGKVRQEERNKYVDYDELKTKAKGFDQLQREKLSAEERLRQDLAAAQRIAADAETRMASTMIDTEIRIAATALGFINPNAALRLVARDGITYSQDAGVKGVQEALEALKGSDSYLVAPAGQTPSRPPNLNPAPRQPGQGRPLTADQREAAAKLRMSEEEYAKGIRDNT